MIASLFRKSTPLNYAVVVIGLLLFFFVFQITQTNTAQSLMGYVFKFSALACLFASLFMANFIVKRNGLSRDSAYTILFFLSFLLLVPTVFDDLRLILANFFILLSMRRLVSLHSAKAIREKIFDASLWIFLASFFSFWCIVFILLVFISILFHAARDYRNWFLPPIALCTALVVFLMFSLAIDPSWIDQLIAGAHFNLRINYFDNNFQNAALSIYATMALFFVVSLVASLSNRPVILQASFQKLLWWFFLGVAVFVLSPAKSNNFMLFTFAPLAMMATSHVETSEIKWQREVVTIAVVAIATIGFFVQI